MCVWRRAKASHRPSRRDSLPIGSHPSLSVDVDPVGRRLRPVTKAQALRSSEEEKEISAYVLVEETHHLPHLCIPGVESEPRQSSAISLTVGEVVQCLPEILHPGVRWLKSSNWLDKATEFI